MFVKGGIELLREVLSTQAHTPSMDVLGASSRAIEMLDSKFDYVLLAEEMSFAYEVMQVESNIPVFLHMKGDAQVLWLRRQIPMIQAKYT
ncbi:Aste57867_12312 [Aphanomyces stellatus]|uniref:Aste57867_12312 protein n=1 Tax=Aphanomyces stellatus TaxID=120398 RepID=A0A485KX86_9STRA|nr:hypothetical protein As57867_012266 [Aphanomyces stellatus]VFT89164.1 Aste57867_12312 [Aphanomyces stellatus]